MHPAAPGPPAAPARAPAWPVVVLCGGRGTRAHPATAELPKPMLPIAGRPVLEHVLEVYARQGVREMVLSAGHLAEVIDDWAAATARVRGWDVTVVDTGADAGTAERLTRLAGQLPGPFYATYGDGLGNVDLAALAARHGEARAGGGTATVTTVPLRSQFGTLELDAGDRVTGFTEKPVLAGHWVNAGFFVFEGGDLAGWTGADLERDVLPGLAATGRLAAHRHPGFWSSMDTQKDQAELHRLAVEGGSPWLDLPWLDLPLLGLP